MHVCPECGASFDEEGVCVTDGNKLISNADDPLIGLHLAPYQIVQLLGVGGMGRVYKGIHPTIGSRVAIKVLSRDCANAPELVERFFAEARAVNVIRHESIVNVLDLATLPDGRPYIVMEYLDGSSLSAIIDSGELLPLGTFVQLVCEVLEALDAAHSKSIVHRDLKPDNIFVSPIGRAKVLDFGIAKLMPEQSGRSGPTRAGSLLGTPHYMAPEQAQGHAVDARSDIYAAGVILFEGTTGQKPFSADSLYELLRQQIEVPAPSPRALRADIPPALEAIILKALAKNPDARQQSARQLASELDRARHFLGPADWGAIGSAHTRKRIAARAGSATDPTLLAEESSDAQAEPLPLRRSQSLPTPLSGNAPSRQRPTPSRSRIPIAIALLLLAGAGVTAAIVAKEDGDASAADAAPAIATLASDSISDGNSDAANLEVPQAEPVDAALVPLAGDLPGMQFGTVPSTVLPTPPATVPATVPATKNNSIQGPKSGKIPPDAGGSQPDDTGLKLVAPAAAPDISHRSSKTPSPAAFDIDSFVPTAYKKARAVFPDAELFRIDAEGVLPNGKANLTLDDNYSVLFRFQSPSRAKRPAELPLGVAHKPTCLYYVNVTAAEVDAYGLDGWKCDEPYAGRPKCSAKKIWDRGVSMGAPATHAVASLWYAHGQGKSRWHFSIQDTAFSWWIPDDC